MSAFRILSTVSLSAIIGTLIQLSTMVLSADFTTFQSSSRKTTLLPESNNTSSTVTLVVISEEERQQYLQHLQANTTTTMIPAMVFLIILAVTGLVGNTFVMFVYSQKFQWSATRILIISIAVFDLVANVFAIPGDIYDMFHIWDFDNPAFCRARMFFSAFTTLSSAMALLAIAVVRYRKVCAPHNWQITIRKSKIISFVVTVLGLLFSVPYAILNGRQTKKTPRPDIFGYECTTDDSYVNTKWPLMNNGFFLLLFISCCGPLTVLYILIGVQAWKHSKIHGASTSPAATTSTTFASKPSKAVDQSEESESNAERKVSISAKKAERSPSTGTTDCNSINTEDIAMKEFSPDREVKDNLEQYTVRIFKDRVEIRTPMMGEFIVNLQKTTLGLADVNDQQDKTYEPLYQNENQQSFDLAGESDVDASDAANKEKQDVFDDSNPVKTNDEKCQYGSLNVTCNEGGITSNENRTDEPHGTIFHLNEHSQVTGTVYENIFLSSEIPTRRENSFDEKDSDKKSIQSTKSNSNEDPDDFDPVAALKWVDIIYCPEGDQAIANPDTTNSGTSFSYRISPNNSLLQKTEWLRNIIIEAVSKTASKSKRSGEVTEITIYKNTETEILDSEKVKDNARDEVTESRRDYLPGMDGSRLRDTYSIKKRLKELVTKGNSMLKMGSQRSKTKRRPLGRTTAMLIIISLIYALGFIPHLGLMFYKFTSPDKYENMTMVELSFYNLFLRSYFINCAANPIIYSLCDINFRRECFGLLKCFSRRRL